MRTYFPYTHNYEYNKQRKLANEGTKVYNELRELKRLIRKWAKEQNVDVPDEIKNIVKYMK